MNDYQIISIDKLQPFLIRSIRPDVIEKLKTRIAGGFNPARPLTVVPNNGGYIVADGNHRLQTLCELGIKEVPVIIRDGDPYWLAVQGNTDEDTYAPMDLFDWLDIIRALKGQGLTQEKIGEKIGWSRDLVARYDIVNERIVTDTLNICKDHQKGRVTENVTLGTFDFTEGWFRSSGLYDLEGKYQERLIKEFIADKCNWRKDYCQREASKYKRWQHFIGLAQTELVNSNDLNQIVPIIENDTFKDEQALRRKIADFNKASLNKIICGDAIIELSKIDDASIDIVITDPPYGIDYTSNHSVHNEYVSKKPIGNDTLNKALEVLGGVLSILSTKTKPDAHFYIFTSWKVYIPVHDIVSQYLNIKNIIVWDKGNWSAGDLSGAWGNQYELIIFATKGNKPVKRRGDIISAPRISTTNSITSTQKPIELITELLKVSAQNADTICDPFMGSGSAIKAAQIYGNLNYIGIEIDRGIFEKAKVYINK